MKTKNIINRRKELLRKKEKRKLHQKGNYGTKTEINKYRGKIVEYLYDEKVLEEQLEAVTNYKKENLVDSFKKYLNTVEQNIRDLTKEAGKIIDRTYKKGTERVIDKDGNKIEAEEPDKDTPERLTQQQQTHYRNLTKANSRAVNNVIEKGLEKGKSEEEIAKDIKKVSKRITENKARTISRTEITKSHRLGQIDTLKETDFENYNFIHSNDSKVCPICKDLQGPNGKEYIYSLEHAGDKNNPLPVSHSHVNCRCCVIAHS